MSNICFTTYKVVGSKNSITKFYETIKKLDSRKTPLIENDWYNPKLWLGCLVKVLGGDPDKVYCRGTITYYEMEGKVLTIATETSWREMCETRHFIEKCFPDLKIFYREEEEGGERFYTNDVDGVYFKERYYLEGSNDIKYFETIIEVAEYVKKIIGHNVDNTFNSIVKALTAYVNKNETDEDMYYNLYEFQVVNN